ncbi:MAG: aminotransferase class I/II-fold pyridoxal phosphate-dependent enzyme [Ilumatobacteraceae bacterium]
MTDPFGFDDVDPGWLAAKAGAKWHGHPGMLNAWVADMDFPPAAVVTDAVRARLDANDLGYPDWGWPRSRSQVVPLFAERAARRYGWDVPVDEVREFCDVVQAVQLALMLATEPGDAVVLHTPSYPPLWRALRDMGRRQIDVPWVDGAFDHDALDAQLASQPAKVLLLCHPHNPTGHRFTRAELEQLAGIAERHDLVIISDEIHADLTLGGPHIPIASISAETAARTVTVHSASKAFNLAGMRHAIAHVGAAVVRDRIGTLPDHLLGQVNLLAATATEAAWTQGDAWLDAVKVCFDRNRRLLADLLSEHLPLVRYTMPDATYLAWLDCSALGLDGDEPFEHFRSRGVQLSPGLDFGPLGAGHVGV